MNLPRSVKVRHQTFLQYQGAKKEHGNLLAQLGWQVTKVAKVQRGGHALNYINLQSSVHTICPPLKIFVSQDVVLWGLRPSR